MNAESTCKYCKKQTRNPQAIFLFGVCNECREAVAITRKYVEGVSRGIDLTYNEIALLVHDALAASIEDDITLPQWLDRIGGARNLESYAACLKAGAK